MATDTEVLPDEITEEDGSAPSGRKRLITRALVVVALLAIVAVECLVAYMYVPSREESQELAEEVLAVPEAALPPEPLEEEEEPLPPNLAEVELGSFTVTAYQPAASMTLRIEFHLFGTVDVEDEAEFRDLMAKKGNRIRDNVIVTIRSADLTDLTDARLALIKRTILETTNQTLGKPLLQSIVFSEFMFMEQ